MSGWCATTCARPSRMREMLHEQKLLSAADLDAIRGGLTALARRACSRPVAHRAGGRGWPDGARAQADRAHRRRPGGRVHLGRSRNDQVLTALRLYLRDAVERTERRRHRASRTRSSGWREREQGTALPGYTHMQQAMPSSVPLWAGGFAAEIRDDAREPAPACQRRIGKIPWARRRATARPGCRSTAKSTTARARLRPTCRSR